MSTTIQFPRILRFRGPVAIIALCVIGLITIPSFFLLNPHNTSSSHPSNADRPVSEIFVDPNMSLGGIIMPKLGNETAKAELGRATWKLIHTMAARYPEKPRSDERAAVKQWIYLLSRLYPCGECAVHFQKLLKEHPPQTSSRTALSNWACSVHNLVNVRLGKPEFDCGTLFDVYKCGCADEPGSESNSVADASKDDEDLALLDLHPQRKHEPMGSEVEYST